MTLEEFVDNRLLPTPEDFVYVAVMEQTDGTYYLEVETVPMDTIGGTWDTETSDLEEARRQADQLESILNSRGIFVYHNRENWEARSHER